MPDRLEPEALAQVGRLASRLSGEMRQPLGVMRNAVYFLNLQLGTAQDEKVRRHLGFLLRELKVIAGIIDNLSGLTATAPPGREDSDLEVIITAALEQVGPGVRVETAVPPHATLFCDPGQLRLAVANAVANAVEAVGERGKVRVVCHQTPEETVIEIADTGPGMPPEVTARVCEPMFTTSRSRPGLGMAAARALVGANGGRVEIQSAPGRGTTVRYRFHRH